MSTKKPASRKGKEPATPDTLSHKTLMAPMSAQVQGQDLPFLGHARAVVIVCQCAKTSPLNLFRTLSELGVDGIPFQMCVYGSVKYLGYKIDIDKIPDAPDSTLISVVNVIQNAPKA